MKKKCLPCAVHFRKPLKDIVTPLVNELNKEQDRVDDLHVSDADYDRMVDAAYAKFQKKLDKFDIISTDGGETLHECIYCEGVYEIAKVSGDYYIRQLE